MPNAQKAKAKKTGLKLTTRPRSPYWYVRGKVQGVEYCESTGTSDEDEARLYLLRREQEIRECRDVEAAGPTFGDAVIAYLEVRPPNRFIPKLLDHFDGVALADIDQEAADKAAVKLYPRNKPASHVRAVYKPLKSILRRAAKKKLCPLPDIENPEVIEPTIKAAGDDYVDALLPHLSPRMKAVVLLATDGGIRTSEILRLKWEDIDFELREFFVETTKNGEPFLQALTDRALVALANLPGEKRGVVFDFSRYKVNRDLAKARKAARLPYMKLHQIGRHTFAARLLKQDHSLHTVMKAGNWKDYKMVSKNYGHLERGHIHDIVRNPKRKTGH